MLLVHLGHRLAQLVAPRGLFESELVLQLLHPVAHRGRGLEVLLVDGLVLVGAELADLLLELLQLVRRRGQLHAHAGRGLVDEVDRLVRQGTIADVAVTEHRGGVHGRVGDGDAVVLLVERLHAVEDLDRLGQRRLVDEHRLEPALEGRVLLDVLAVLVQRRCADALDLAARERGLEDVGGVDGAFRGARADQRVQLVDEQHDLATRADLVEDLLQALLELTAVLGAGDQRAHVEREHALVLQRLGHVAEIDLLSEAFGDRGLADAGLADERRVVLGPPAEDLDDALDLQLAPDHRVELVAARELGEVAAELIQQGRLGRLLRRRLRLGLSARVVQQALDLRAHLVQGRAEVLEHVCGDALAFDEQAEQQVLGADVVVAHPARFLEGDLDHLLDARGRNDLLDDDPLVATEHRLDRLSDLADLHPKVVQHLGSEPLAFAKKAQEKVFSSDVAVVGPFCFFLRERQNLLGSLSKSLKRIHGAHVDPSLLELLRLGGASTSSIY